MKVDAYQMVTDRICELLEKGFIPWAKPWAMTKSCAWSGHDGHVYTLLNQFMLADLNKKYKDADEMTADIAGEWVTFKQAQERGGNVKKGERGRKIIFFSLVPTKDKDGNETGEVHPVISWSTVFKISQCDGVEQKFHTDAGMLYDFNPEKSAEEVASEYAMRESIKITHRHGDKACYSPEKDAIMMPLPEQFENNSEYYSTLFHEMVHSTGHPKRLNRIVRTAAFGSQEYSQEELVAEIGSASIMATLGIENQLTFRNSAGYIQNWLQALRNDKKLIVTASARAEKAIKMIFGIKEAQ